MKRRPRGPLGSARRDHLSLRLDSPLPSASSEVFPSDPRSLPRYREHVCSLSSVHGFRGPDSTDVLLDFTFQPQDILPRDRAQEERRLSCCYFLLAVASMTRVYVCASNNRLTVAPLPRKFCPTLVAAVENGTPARLSAACKPPSVETTGSCQPCA